VSAACRRHLEVAVDAARAAGRLLESHFERLASTALAFKGRRDLLTRADSEAEALILERLGAAFPDDPILAEESGLRGRGGDGARWVVDPLDGTTNFVHSLPVFAVSIARVDAGGVPELGVVHLPRLQELFAARRGAGATLNGRPLRVSARRELIESVIATGFHYRRHELPASNLDNFVKLALKVRGMRRMGAAAVDLAYVAAGRLDAFWELHLSPWDVAAGGLLVEEAGGRTTDLKGDRCWLEGGEIVASNGTALHERLLALLSEPLAGWGPIQRAVGGV